MGITTSPNQIIKFQPGNTPFDLLTRLITVRDVAQPIYGRFSVSDSVEGVANDWLEDCGLRDKDPMGQIALAEENGQVVGWFGLDMLDEGKIIWECLEPLRPNGMLTADTPIIEAAKAFAADKPHLYFILNENRIDGWLG